MHGFACALVLVGSAALAFTHDPQAPDPPLVHGTSEARGIEFWRAIAAGGYAVPEGESPLQLLLELSTHFGSPSTELRDELGYGISAAWTRRGQLLDEEERATLVQVWSDHLHHGRDANAEDPRARDHDVLFRSFSALALSLLAADDLHTRSSIARPSTRCSRRRSTTSPRRRTCAVGSTTSGGSTPPRTPPTC